MYPHKLCKFPNYLSWLQNIWGVLRTTAPSTWLSLESESSLAPDFWVPDLYLQLEPTPGDPVRSTGSCAFSKACAGPRWATGLYKSKWLVDVVQPGGADPDKVCIW